MATLSAVADTKDAREWALLPHRIHGARPGWTPPLKSDAVAELDPRRNPFLRHAETRHLLLRENGRTVGRIAATVHPASNEGQGRRDVFFGFPVVEDHRRHLPTLLDACAEIGREWGMDTIAGPYNYWAGAECGVLLDDHDRRTALFQPWNPPELGPSLEALGFAVRSEMAAYEVPVIDLAPVRGLLRRAADATAASTGVHTRRLRMKSYRSEMALIRELHAQAFSRDAEVTPYPEDVFAHMTGALRSIIDPGLVLIAERQGTPVGFAVTVPDAHELFARWGGRLGPFDVLRLPLDRRTVDGAVVLLAGAVPSAPMGVGHLLIADTLDALDRGGYGTMHSTWVHREKSVMKILLESHLGLAPDRRWAIYERVL